LLSTSLYLGYLKRVQGNPKLLKVIKTG